MFRKLSLVLAVSAALSPVGVFALGLGDMSTASALNEKFNADIELMSVAPGELDSIKVSLASSADFARAGLERPFLLSKLRFEPVQLDDGQPVIRVTTNDPVREPFLNFLLEVNWPKGRLIREFTVLLDPPVTLDRRPPAIAPAVTVPVARVSRAAPEPEPAPSPESEVETMSPAEGSMPPQAGSVGEYGPVRAGMTLWGIAEELDVPEATTEQVAIALFRHNPESFAGYDINRLMTGEILRIPDREFIESLSQRQAHSEFFARVEGRRGTVPFSRAGRLRIATKPAETEQQPAKTPGGEIERVKTDIRMVREASESTRQETEDLRSRIRELESQLNDIRSLLKLKSDQLAQLQATQIDAPPEDLLAIVPTGDEMASVDSELTETATPVSEAMQEIDLPDAMSETQESAAQELDLSGAAEEATPESVLTKEVVEEADKQVEAGLEIAVEQELEASEQAEPETAEQPESRSVVPLEPDQAPTTAEMSAKGEPQGLKSAPDKPVEQPGLLDMLRSDPTVMGVGGAVAVVLLSLGWLLIRRRRQADDQFEESMLVRSGEGSTTVALDSVSDVAEQRDSEEETSFISDFSPSDIDALQEETGEVDPAAEADVYIAYGRYQQAESLVNLAIEKEPERLDLKAKLLEIYFTTRNAAAFAGLAEKLQAIGAQSKAPQLWKQVESMGQELIPGHELFGSSPVADHSDSAPVKVAELVPADFNQEESGSALVEESKLLPTDSEAFAGLDLDLDSELSEFPDQSQGELGGAAPPAQFESPEEPGLPPSQPSLVPDTADEESEFSIDLADLDSLEDVELGNLGLEPSEQLDVAFDQPAASAMAEVTQDGLSLPTEESEVFSLDELEPEASTIDLDQLDFAEAGFGETKEIKTGDSEPLSELLKEAPEYGDEEIETKLDLARAYMEMGDGEGAKEILTEVLGEGSDQQKSVAQELMNKAS